MVSFDRGARDPDLPWQRIGQGCARVAHRPGRLRATRRGGPLGM